LHLKESDRKHENNLFACSARSFLKQQRESYFERQFKHLQYAEAVKVYEVATEQEKPLLNRVLREKRQNLIRRHATIPPVGD
jgi:DNA-binding protein Fis